MQRQSHTEQAIEMLDNLDPTFFMKVDPDCYITKVIPKLPSVSYYMDQAHPVKPVVTYYKKHKVLPIFYTRKQAFDAEKRKGVCYGCDEPNFNVEWIWNHEHSYYELKNACDECMACGNLEGEDCENHL